MVPDPFSPPRWLRPALMGQCMPGLVVVNVLCLVDVLGVLLFLREDRERMDLGRGEGGR